MVCFRSELVFDMIVDDLICWDFSTFEIRQVLLTLQMKQNKCSFSEN